MLEWRRELLYQKRIGALDQQYYSDEQWEIIQEIIYGLNDYYFKTSNYVPHKEIYGKTINSNVYFSGLRNFIDRELIVYGTGYVANLFMNFLNDINKTENVIGFCETSVTKELFWNKPVFAIGNISIPQSASIIIATAEKYHASIIKTISRLGVKNDVIVLDDLLIKEIRLNEEC